MRVPQSVTLLHAIQTGITVDAAEPLFKRAPRLDEQGRPVGDFMMIIPRLGTRPPRLIQIKADKIRMVLEQFTDLVVFADLNLKLNVLWVTVRQSPRAYLDISQAISAAIPEALLVAHPRFI